jgi:hypothetical protein
MLIHQRQKEHNSEEFNAYVSDKSWVEINYGGHLIIRYVAIRATAVIYRKMTSQDDYERWIREKLKREDVVTEAGDDQLG